MRIALYQTQTGPDPGTNGRDLVRAIAEAAKGGAVMLFTPALSGLLDRDRERAARHPRDDASDTVLATVRAPAAENGIRVHLGPLSLHLDNHAGRQAYRDCANAQRGDQHT